MSADKIDPNKKHDSTISSADKPPKTAQGELTEDQLKSVSGGMRKSGGDPQTSGKEFLP